MDFGSLPDVVWVKILSFLPLGDRSRLSQTNYKISTIFSCPSLWSECIVAPFFKHFNSSHELHCSFDLLSLKQNKEMLEKYGSHVRKLTLKGDFENDIVDLILAKCGRLETVYFGTDSCTNRQWGSSQKHKNYIDIINKCSNTLKVIALDSWPSNDFDPILNCLPSDIKELSLFHPEVNASTWIRMNVAIPPPENIMECVSRMKVLTTLALHCSSVSCALLDLISSTITHCDQPTYSNLTHLKILVIYESSANSFFDIPAYKWRKLSERSPKISIDITIANSIPDMCAINFLTNSALNSLTFCQYSRYKPTIFTNLITAAVDGVSGTSNLKSFIDYSEGCSDISDLLNFVRECPNLDCLIYNGNIKDTTVLQLVQAKNGCWRKFKINLDNVIVTHRLPDGFEFGDDDVIAINKITGEVRQVSVFFEPEKNFFATADQESHRRDVLEKMEEEVKKHLRCSWQPLRRLK